jgi:hypothetical protein
MIYFLNWTKDIESEKYGERSELQIHKSDQNIKNQKYQLHMAYYLDTKACGGLGKGQSG